MALIGLAFSAQAQTSDDNARWKAALNRFPQAVANKDGVLIMAEAKAFKKTAGESKGGRRVEMNSNSSRPRNTGLIASSWSSCGARWFSHEESGADPSFSYYRYEALEPLGLHREVVVIVGGFSTASGLARASDLIASVPERHTGNLRSCFIGSLVAAPPGHAGRVCQS